LGILCGKGSGQVEVIDIDSKYDLTGTMAHEFFQMISDHDESLFKKLRIIQSPTLGFHLYYRCEIIEGNQKLARRPSTEQELKADPKDKVKVLFETRGLGGFIVAPPTPGYTVWQDNPIPTITPEERAFLLDAARSFNELIEIAQPKNSGGFDYENSPYEITPWDDYNQSADVVALLEKHGWAVDHKHKNADRIYLTRPGKSEGISGDYHKTKKLFKSWSTSQDSFRAETAYGPTAVYAQLEHNGDFTAAAKKLESMGYGTRKTKTERTASAGPKVLGYPMNGVGIKETTANDYAALFRKSVLDQGKEYPLPVPVITINQNSNSIPFLTLKSFSLWQGKQKSKKTTALALAVAAFIKHQHTPADGLFQGAMSGTVLFFDNEQGESYAARTMKLILKLADVETTPHLIYCDLREFAPAERMKIIQAGIESTPDVRRVVIDGLVDLLTDFMEASEGHLTTTEILKLCSRYDIHVAGVLHQNKNDKNARAHIGTISSQKCEIEISTEVDPDDRNQSFVVCVNSRGLPFEQFAIRWDKGSLPRVNDEWNAVIAKDVKSVKNYELGREAVEAIFKPFTALSFAESIKQIMNVTRKSESAAKRYLKDYLGWEFIEKGTDGNYRRKMPEGSRVHEGSNRVQ
jgi:hypothetical protein